MKAQTLVSLVAFLGLAWAIRTATIQENLSDERGCVWDSSAKKMRCAGDTR